MGERREGQRRGEGRRGKEREGSSKTLTARGLAFIFQSHQSLGGRGNRSWSPAQQLPQPLGKGSRGRGPAQPMPPLGPLAGEAQGPSKAQSLVYHAEEEI